MAVEAVSVAVPPRADPFNLRSIKLAEATRVGAGVHQELAGKYAHHTT
jgi:hypothetical protein